MTIKEYIKKLEEQKRLAVDRFGNLTEIEKQVIDASFVWLVDNVELSKGQFEPTEQLTEQMNEFVNAVVKIIANNKEYQKKLSDYLSNISVIGENLLQFHSTANNLDIKNAGITNVQNAVVSEIIDQFTDNGLNAHFAQPLRDIIHRNVLAGMNLKEAKTYLFDYISSGKDQSGKLVRYLDQTAIQGVSSYTGAINTKLAETFEFTGIIISGSIIETSSEQCIYAVEHADANGYLPNNEWKHILEIAKANKRAKLIEGTTLLNLHINLLHWGCKHDFTPSVKNKT